MLARTAVSVTAAGALHGAVQAAVSVIEGGGTVTLTTCAVEVLLALSLSNALAV